MWCRAVIIGYQEIRRFHTTFEIGAYRATENGENIFRRGAYADVFTDTDNEWTKIKCGPATIWSKPFFVGFDHFFTGADK